MINYTINKPYLLIIIPLNNYNYTRHLTYTFLEGAFNFTIISDFGGAAPPLTR